MSSNSSSSDEEPEPTNWVDAHFDELSDLFAQFKEHGQALFGRAFLQHSNFGDFVNFVQQGTLISSDPRVRCRSSGYSGSARRWATSHSNGAR